MLLPHGIYSLFGLTWLVTWSYILAKTEQGQACATYRKGTLYVVQVWPCSVLLMCNSTSTSQGVCLPEQSVAAVHRLCIQSIALQGEYVQM